MIRKTLCANSLLSLTAGCNEWHGLAKDGFLYRPEAKTVA
jgi:hypothetical protein